MIDELTLKILKDDENFKKYLFVLAMAQLYVAIMDRQRGINV